MFYHLQNFIISLNNIFIEKRYVSTVIYIKNSKEGKMKIGIIGGSGLYQIEGLEIKEERQVATPFGKPSDSYLIGELEGKEIVFLPRHGRGHKLLPSEINYRANIFGFKLLGVERIISVAAVGSLKEGIHPLDVVIPDQFFDRTKRRIDTFFGNGIAAHIGIADPVCPQLFEFLYQSAVACGATVHKGGTYVNIEGPSFSTRSESKFYRSLGFDVIGMTNLTEAKLCREAEICYATLAMVTDYDVWKEEDVDIQMVVRNLQKNAEMAKRIITEVIKRLPEERKCPCANALKDAIITSPDLIPQELKEKLKPLLGKYLKSD